MADPRPARLHADIAVVGAGPAGIAAAVAAAGAGKRVCLLDAAPRPGGQVWRHRHREELPGTARRWLARLDASGVEQVYGAAVVDAVPGFALGVDRGGHPTWVEASVVVIATGAQELFLPFPGWTLPGVLGVGGAQALLKAGLDVRGKRVAVAGTGPLLLPVAAALARAGARLQLVAEQAPPERVRQFALSLWREPGKLVQAAAYRAAFAAVRYRWGTWVKRVDADPSGLRVTYTDGRSTWAELRDLLCTASGLVPATDLAQWIGCALDTEAVVVDDLQRTTVSGVYAAGEPTGNTGAEAALVEGTIAGLTAAGWEAEARRHFSERNRHRAFSARTASTFALRDELRARAAPDTILCRCEDVPMSAVHAGWGAREAKLASRAGMGACQGRVCGAALRHLRGGGHDTKRPPLAPVAVGTLAAICRTDPDVEGAR